MKTLRLYLDSALIGVLAEYCFRVESNKLQILILFLLTIKAVLITIENFNE